jgi:hypothetical protein
MKWIPFPKLYFSAILNFLIFNVQMLQINLLWSVLTWFFKWKFSLNLELDQIITISRIYLVHQEKSKPILIWKINFLHYHFYKLF